MSKIRIRLAQTKQEFEQALSLLNESNRNPEPRASGDVWLLKQHALPSTNTIIAERDGAVIGALSVFGENPFLLPVERSVDLRNFKESLSGRVAEVSLPGLAKEYRDSHDLLLALYHFAVCFGSTYCHYDAFVSCAERDWGPTYTKLLRYSPLATREKSSGQCYVLNARECGDYRQAITPQFACEFRFPEKKFFLVAHQNMKPEVLDYLFNERTHVFSTLNDFELRVLKNIYDYGEYAKVLPERTPETKYARLPKYRRFPMNCEGYLRTPDGRRIHFVVDDVSREGLKLRTEQPLKPGQVHALTISIGVMKQTELIARTVWVNDLTQSAGLEISSGDKNWAALIEYLEKDFLRTAA